MTKSSLCLIAIGALAALAACAQQPAAATAANSPHSRSQCFFAPNVNGFGHATDTSIDIQVGANTYYRLDLIGPCHDIDWATGLAFKTTTGGSSWVCNGADAEVIVPGQIAGRCLVTGVHPITKEQWQAPPHP